jgi:hypothetical protein
MCPNCRRRLAAAGWATFFAQSVTDSADAALLREVAREERRAARECRCARLTHRLSDDPAFRRLARKLARRKER